MIGKLLNFLTALSLLLSVAMCGLWVRSYSMGHGVIVPLATRCCLILQTYPGRIAAEFDTRCDVFGEPPYFVSGAWNEAAGRDGELGEFWGTIPPPPRGFQCEMNRQRVAIAAPLWFGVTLTLSAGAATWRAGRWTRRAGPVRRGWFERSGCWDDGRTEADLRSEDALTPARERAVASSARFSRRRGR